MRVRPTSLPWLLLLVLPVVVALARLPAMAAVGLVVLVLGWRWLLALRGLASRPAGPELVLETIAASHFVEKVRWALDRLGVDYREEIDVGTLGVFFTGRTVPRLHVRTGAVVSTIGNSSDILRYLWGRYTAERGDDAAFLEPTPEALELERRLDEYGVHLQRWIYARTTPHGRLCRQVWGVGHPEIPRWQRLAMHLLHPLQRAMIRRAFRISPRSTARSVARIEELLDWVEDRLGDGRRSLLGGDRLSYADLAFAAFSGLWVWPEGYGGGRAGPAIPDRAALPAEMLADLDAWRARFPRATGFVERLYREERSR